MDALAWIETAEQPRQVRATMSALIRAGLLDEGDTALAGAVARWPENTGLREQAVALAIAAGNIERAEACQERWAEAWAAEQAAQGEASGDAAAALARYREATADQRVSRDVRELRADLDQVAEVDAEVLYRLAQDLQSAHQFGESAAEWERLGREFPAFGSHDASRSLWYAASALQAAGDIVGSRELFSEVAQRFPDTPSGESARVMLQALPR